VGHHEIHHHAGQVGSGLEQLRELDLHEVLSPLWVGERVDVLHEVFPPLWVGGRVGVLHVAHG